MSFLVVMLHECLQWNIIYHYIILQIWLLLKHTTDLLQILYGYLFGGPLQRL